MFERAVIDIFGIYRAARGNGIGAGFGLDFQAVFLPFGDNVVRVYGFHRHRAADAAFHIAVERRAFSTYTLLTMFGST